DDAGRVHRIAIPTSDDAKDLRDTIEEIVGISAAIEGRNASEVIADMMSVVVDSIDVRIVPPHGESRILLSSAPKIYGSLLDLISGSETAEKEDEKLKHPKGSKPMEAPTGDLWLLPAAPRSFAFRVESVTPADTEVMLGQPPNVPLSHKAICRVVRG